MSTKEALKRRFDVSRLVFWKDEGGEAQEEAEALAEELGVEFVVVQNNEFGLKDRLIRQEPDTKFLIYRPGPLPTNEENWLWDLELANQVFDADQVTLITHELGLDAHRSLVEEHLPFFRARSRVDRLAKLVRETDSEPILKQKMMAVLLKQDDHNLTEVLRALLVEHSEDGTDGYEALTKFGLEDDLWNQVRARLGYKSSSPSVRDFSLWLFALAEGRFQKPIDQELELAQLGEARILFDSLRNHLRSSEAMKTLARKAARELDFDASAVDYKNAGTSDVFAETEGRVVASLAEAASLNAISRQELMEVLRDRQHSPWKADWRHEHDAIEAAVELSAETAEKPWCASFDDGLDRYRSQWFLVDQNYRHYLHAARSAGGHLLDDLTKQVEVRYLEFLRSLGNEWQKQVDEVNRWQSGVLRSQAGFYDNYIRPHVAKGKRKAVVIISDALRYEVAEELAERIQAQDRFQARLNANLGVIPSFTPLGMAALLPHREITVSDDGKHVEVDGRSTAGTKARAKVLETVEGTALQAEDVFAMDPLELRDFYRHHKVIYVYHNRIDRAGEGDRGGSDVFDAAETAMNELEELLRVWTNANATNIWITADHGFLFRNSKPEDHEFLSVTPAGDEVTARDPRFALGHDLKEDQSLKKFEAGQLGWKGDVEAQFPTSVFPMRAAGSVPRYAHGGTSLQEVVVPVLHVRKGREDDTRTVEVRLITGSDRISTSRLVVEFDQGEYVGGKVLPTTLRVALYVGDEMISDRKQITFDTEESSGADLRRELPLLLAPNADKHNHKTATLRVEEQVPGTSQWRPYREVAYQLRLGFMRDF